MASSAGNKPGKRDIATGYTQGIHFYLKSAPERGKFQQIDTAEAVKPGCINVVS